MTDFDSDSADLRAQWDAATQSGSLRPTAEEEAAMRRHILAAISAAPANTGRGEAPSAGAAAPELLTGRPLSLEYQHQLQHQTQRHRQHRQRWAFVASLAAAAVLVVSVVLREAPRSTSGNPSAASAIGPSVASDPARVATPDEAMLAGLDAAGSAPMRTALQLASREASPEFAALDAAADELDAALARDPDDAELRAFRAALDARRDELAQRIRSVTE